MYTPQNNWRTNTINYNIDSFCVEHIENQFNHIVKKFGTSLTPYCKWNSKMKMVENDTNMWKLDLNVLKCHFCVCDPWTTELHEKNE